MSPRERSAAFTPLQCTKRRRCKFFNAAPLWTLKRAKARAPSLNFARESLLPQGLEQNQRDAVGQVQRTRLRVEHRNPQPMFTMIFQKLFWQTRRLASEHQIIVRRKFHLAVILRAVGFDEPQPRGGRKFFRERRPVLPAMPLDLLPVIHARALELRIVQLETERLDEVQNGFRGRAQSRHVARVRRNFLFNQNDVHSFYL